MSKPRIPRKAKKEAKKIARQYGLNGYMIPAESLLWVPVAHRHVPVKFMEVKK